MKKSLFEISGKVVEGEKLGAKFGIATANVFLEEVPEDIEKGVYVVECRLKPSPNLSPRERDSGLYSGNSLRDFSAGEIVSGLMHFGDLKTFGRGFSVEVHLFDFEGNIYGKTLEIFGVQFLREIWKFQNADALFSQIGIDVNQGRKYFLRDKIRKNWGAISAEKLEELSEKAVESISEHKKFLEADVILAYAPIKNKELDFVEKLMGEFPGKRWFFPKIMPSSDFSPRERGSELSLKNPPRSPFNKGEDDAMEFFEVGNYGDLVEGKFGILEPGENPSKSPLVRGDFSQSNILCLVPVEGIDRAGNRLGKGGGFYDRFFGDILKGQPQGIVPTFSSLAVVPEFCVVESVPVNDWDMGVDDILVV